MNVATIIIYYVLQQCIQWKMFRVLTLLYVEGLIDAHMSAKVPVQCYIYQGPRNHYSNDHLLISDRIALPALSMCR